MGRAPRTGDKERESDQTQVGGITAAEKRKCKTRLESIEG